MALASIIESVLGTDLPVAVRAYDGSSVGPPDPPATLVPALAGRVAPDRHRARRARLRAGLRRRRPRPRRRHLRRPRAARPAARRQAPSAAAPRRRAGARLAEPAAVAAAARRGAPARPPSLGRARPRRDRHHYDVSNDFYRLVPRPVAHVLVRGVQRRRHVAGGRAGEQVRVGVAQARPAAGHAAARRRLRLGRHGACTRPSTRRARRRRHGLDAPGRARVEARRRGRARRSRRRSATRTTGSSTTDRSTPSRRSACSSTSARRGWPSTSAGCTTCCRRAAVCSTTASAGRRARTASRSASSRAAASSTATCSPTASCTRSAGSCRSCSRPASRCATSSRCASTTPRRCATGSPTSRRAGTRPSSSSARPRARIWRLYMAGSAVNFEANRTQIHQVLAVKPDNGRSGMPLRPTWDNTPLTADWVTSGACHAGDFAFLDWPGPIPFAHRGGASEVPENTMPAFEHAVAPRLPLHRDRRARDRRRRAARVPRRRARPRHRRHRRHRRAAVVGRARGARSTAASRSRCSRTCSARGPTCASTSIRSTTHAVEPLRRRAAEVRRRRPRVHRRVQRRPARATCAPLLPGVCTSLGPLGTLQLGLAAQGDDVPELPSPCVQVPTHYLDTEIVDAGVRRRGAPPRHAGARVDDRRRRRDDRLLDLGVDGIMTDRPKVLRDVLEQRGQWTS